MRLNESYNKVLIGIYIYIYMSVSLPDMYGVEPADAYRQYSLSLL